MRVCVRICVRERVCEPAIFLTGNRFPLSTTAEVSSDRCSIPTEADVYVCVCVCFVCGERIIVRVRNFVSSCLYDRSHSYQRIFIAQSCRTASINSIILPARSRAIGSAFVIIRFVWRVRVCVRACVCDRRQYRSKQHA